MKEIDGLKLPYSINAVTLDYITQSLQMHKLN